MMLKRSMEELFIIRQRCHGKVFLETLLVCIEATLMLRKTTEIMELNNTRERNACITICLKA